MAVCIIKHVCRLGNRDFLVIAGKDQSLWHEMCDIVTASRMNAWLAYAVKTEKLQFTLDQIPLARFNTNELEIASNVSFHFIIESSFLSSKSHVFGVDTPCIL